MPINLHNCSKQCFGCVRNYKTKHRIEPGEKFNLLCKGIPSEETKERYLSTFPEEERGSLEGMLDPVKWAADHLNWHCLDPDNTIWKLRDPVEYERALEKVDGDESALLGKSRYNRPYQADMLRCNSLRKILRIGRQCIVGDSKVSLFDGSTKDIKDINVGDVVVSIDKDNNKVSSIVTGQWSAGVKPVYKIKTKFGHAIESTSDHRFYIAKQRIDRSNNRSVNDIEHQWMSIDTGLAVGDKIAVLISSLHSQNLTLSNDIMWDYVSEIKEIGQKQTWDLEIQNTNNFIANGILVHNSGKTDYLVVEAAIAGIQQPYHIPGKQYRIVVITPFQSQVEVFFERLLELFRQSNDFQNVVLHCRKSPTWTIELTNGTLYKFFTAGVASASHANAARGQSCNVLIFDEADYLGDEDINAALAPIINDPEARIVMSSTPTGKRELFFKNCYNKEWKEFWYPSHVNPLWGPDQERLFRSQYTELAFAHEILAEFGEQEQGVFQVQYVQRARTDFSYGDYKFNPANIYTIGVDWNDARNGINVSVLEYVNSSQIFRLVWREIINKVEFTQLAACQRIVELNKAWHPIGIYVDAGYGKTQVEVLNKFSGDALRDPARGPGHPDSRIRNVLKRYDFGSSLEVFDLWSQTKVKKDAKAFMVESAVRRFENGDIEISKYDELLERQLQNYIVDHVSVNGRVVYKSLDPKNVGDHLLDSMMLAIVGYIMEATPLGAPKYNDTIHFTGTVGSRRGYGDIPADYILQPDTNYKRAMEKEEHIPKLGRSSLFAPWDEDAHRSFLPAANLSEELENQLTRGSKEGVIPGAVQKTEGKVTQLRRIKRKAQVSRQTHTRKNI